MTRVLVIDDDPGLRGVLRAMLEKAGYEVIEAENGKDGVALFREAPADLVVTDIVMPEQDGLETILELWRDYPHVRVIAISGGSTMIPPEMALHCATTFGALRSFKKPFETEAFLAAVDELAPLTT